MDVTAGFNSAVQFATGKRVRIAKDDFIIAQAAEMYVAQNIPAAIEAEMIRTGASKLPKKTLVGLRKYLLQEFKTKVSAAPSQVLRYFEAAEAKHGCDYSKFTGGLVPDTWTALQFRSPNRYNALYRARVNGAPAPGRLPFITSFKLLKTAWDRVPLSERATYLAAANDFAAGKPGTSPAFTDLDRAASRLLAGVAPVAAGGAHRR